ncbi:MAG: response regulator [Spirochaetales bacterium]|nr:response regulator [Spirochaetales bacterium]
MKTLIVEDDFASRLLLQELLKPYGDSHVAVNGVEAVSVCTDTIKNHKYYDLICLDIMMPEMDGQTALKKIRALEDAAGLGSFTRARIIMTTALGDVKTVMGSYYELCDGYLVKPFSRDQLEKQLRKLNLG